MNKNQKLTYGIAIILVVVTLLTVLITECSSNNDDFYPYINTDTDVAGSYEIRRALLNTVEAGAISEHDLVSYLNDHPVDVVYDPNIPDLANVRLTVNNRIELRSSVTPIDLYVLDHEAYHIALIAKGVPVSQHHALMQANNWCDNRCADHDVQ